MEELVDDIIVTADVEKPLTLRQLYYRLVAAGAIVKHKNEYGRVKRQVKLLRESGALPWEWIVDNARTSYRESRWSGPERALRSTARFYRRDLMASQNVALQLWAESDSVASIIAGAAFDYGIDVMVGRGYSSRGYIWSCAADAVATWRAGKQFIVLHVGDYDPSGEDIYRDLVDTIRLYAIARDNEMSVDEARLCYRHNLADVIGDDLVFERIAVTVDQVVDFDLEPKDTNANDPRAAGWGGLGAVEVEAFRTVDLVDIVRTAIEAHVDRHALELAKEAEMSERTILYNIANTMGGAA